MVVLKIRKPRAILFDTIGTIVKTGWIDQVVFSYIRSNIDEYLQTYWTDEVLKRDVELLRAQSRQDQGPIIAGADEPEEGIRSSVADYVVRCLDDMRETVALRTFRFHMIFDAYARDKMKTHVYTDAAICLANWSLKEDIDLFLLSNGWSYAMKKLFEKTNHSNLTFIIKDYFDTSVGPLDCRQTYETLIAKLGHPAEDLLLLTHCSRQGVAAHRAGLSVILVTTHRTDLARERTAEARLCGLPFVRTFTQLLFKNDAPPASTLGNTENEPNLASGNEASSLPTANSGFNSHVAPSVTCSSAKGPMGSTFRGGSSDTSGQQESSGNEASSLPTANSSFNSQAAPSVFCSSSKGPIGSTFSGGSSDTSGQQDTAVSTLSACSIGASNFAHCSSNNASQLHSSLGAGSSTAASTTSKAPSEAASSLNSSNLGN